MNTYRTGVVRINLFTLNPHYPETGNSVTELFRKRFHHPPADSGYQEANMFCQI